MLSGFNDIEMKNIINQLIHIVDTCEYDASANDAHITIWMHEMLMNGFRNIIDSNIHYIYAKNDGEACNMIQ